MTQFQYPPGSGANPSASVGLSAVNGAAATFMRSDAAPALDQTAAFAFSNLSNTIVTAGGSASVSALLLNGAIFTGGTGTTNFPAVFVQPSGATAATNWSTSGTAFGVNAASGFAGNLIDLQVAGSRQFIVTNLGAVTAGNIIGVNITAGASNSYSWTGRGIITSPASGTVQLGAANAASPVAQTLQAQGSRAGTDSNVGGANLTVTAGNGTGTGTLSSLILQSPVAVGSGSSAQTQTTGLTIKGGQAVHAAYTVATLPTGISGGTAYVTDGDAGLAWGATAVNTGAGATKYLVWFNGSNWTVVGK